MMAYSDTDSVQKEKKNLDLYPTPHQALPPLYADGDYKWADDKYDDSTRVDMGGFANKSYVRDDLFDFDSDEDVITPHDRKPDVISPRDVYEEYAIPDDRTVLMLWLVIALGVVIAISMLAFALWRFRCFEDYTRMMAYSDTDSVQKEKKNLDLYPTPHQALPPLYADGDYKWADDKYDDTTRVDMGGFANKSYVRDDLFDFDSDEDVITPHDRKPDVISPRDVYEEYAIPDDRTVLMLWLVIALGVVIAISMLAFALWRFRCFEDYTRMMAYSDTDSVQKEKKNLDLYPTPHQALPPLYADGDYKWADDKYDDSTRVDMGGFANKSYVRDDLFDFESDEDIITPHDRKPDVISPRDVYEV